jgi:hypothetical protein
LALIWEGGGVVGAEVEGVVCALFVSGEGWKGLLTSSWVMRTRVILKWVEVEVDVGVSHISYMAARSVVLEG